MLRRLTAITALAAAMSIAAAITLATPALAKGPSQARISGPGLAHAIVVSGNGEPGQSGTLATLAQETRLFSVMFGPNAPMPAQLRTLPTTASLGPRYTIIYTVYGQFTRPGEQSGQIRQDLYPRAVGGPVIYTPSRQPGGPVPFFGWFRASGTCPAPLPGSAFHLQRPHRQALRPQPRIRWERSKRGLGPFPGSSRQPRPSRPQRSLAPCCCCAAAIQPRRSDSVALAWHSGEPG